MVFEQPLGSTFNQAMNWYIQKQRAFELRIS